MTPLEYVAWFLLLVTAEFCADAIRHAVRGYKKSRVERVKCEICGLPRKIKKTKDNKHMVCRKCNKLYNDSIKAEEKQQEAS
jgi:hypothetical protein